MSSVVRETLAELVAREGYNYHEYVGTDNRPLPTSLIDAVLSLVYLDDPEPEKDFDWGGGDRQETEEHAAWSERERLRGSALSLAESILASGGGRR